MKSNKIILLFLISIISIMISFSCLNNVDADPNSGIPMPKYLKFKVNIVNNSDLTVDYVLKEVLIGVNVLENTADIFLSQDIYESYKNFDPKDFVETDADKGNAFSVFSYKYGDIKIRGNIKKENSDTLIFYDPLEYRGVETLLIRLLFNGSNEKILAGWPKYYYSKLSNVSLYGFSYRFGNDKKIENHQNLTGNYGVRYSTNSDDSSGDITAYLNKTIYSLKVTINSPDDIQMEVLPETGESF
ncbi:MAG TPA: hypothetical protein PK385_01095 [Spirochaetota bacterium]|nr:hypothetical protein [Spirochaetota bacterium]HOS34101.1 hypothetical protein [Spirochaetota bacterium]HOS54635.1 hypothetical protein [Spirochaetota bacterium]HPK63002.1 hypothetical protein [Spirochaetota bacterium]HQF77133.1 hypothetical protein [Spirochaetota bacterium]